MERKRILTSLAGLAILLLALTLAACGDQTATTSNSSTAPAITATSAPVATNTTTTAPATATTTAPAATATATKAAATPTSTTPPTPKPATATPKPASTYLDTSAKAIEILTGKLTQDKIYSKTALNCLSFVLDQATEPYFDLAILEKHGNGCAGDPATAPVVDRFRVYRASGLVQWYDVISDQYRPYEQYRATRQGK